MAENNIEEIDLVQISKIIAKTFVKTYFFLKKFIKTIFRKSIIPVAIASVVGAIIGGIYSQIKSPVYTSTLIGVSNISNFDEVKPRFNMITELFEKGKYATLATILPLDTVSLSKIPSVVFKYNTKKNPYPIYITIKCKDFNLYDTLNKIIPSLIKNNEYFKLKTQTVLNSNRRIHDRIVGEINALDSLKLKIIAMTEMEQSKNKSFVYSINPSSINESIIRFYEKQIEIESFEKINPDFYVVEYFTPIKISQKEHLFSSIISFSSKTAGIIFGIILLMHFSSYLPKKEDEEKDE
jgi:hypothetical protein